MARIKDSNIQTAIGNILRYGVYLSLAVSLIGGIFYLKDHGSEKVASKYTHFVEKDDSFFDYLGKVFTGIRNLHGEEIVKLGIIILIITPTIRVIFSLLGFILEKDKLYIVITLIVLLIIAISVAGGLG
jgi:uncharacterized membrane protein